MELKAKSLIKNTKELSKEAISLALNGEWEQAAVLNRVILDVSHNDVETMNRLGKALMESGQYGEARGVLARVVEAAPYNNIAKKNLARLEQLEGAPAPAKQGRKVSGIPQLFIEESGKSGTTILQKPGSPRLLGSIAPGDPLTLAVEGSGLCVYVRDDEYLGRVDPKLGRRVMKLIEAGNKYEAAVISVKEQGPSIIIRETYRHPSLHNVCSFPFKSKEDHRKYLGENILRYLEDTDLDDAEDEALIDNDSYDDSEWDE